MMSVGFPMKHKRNIERPNSIKEHRNILKVVRNIRFIGPKHVKNFRGITFYKPGLLSFRLLR